MPSEEADGKGEATTGDAVVVAGAGAPAPPKPTSQQQPPAYAQAKNAYEALWKQHSDTRPLATQAPAGNAAASSSAPPEATAVNAQPPAPAATAPSAPPLKLHAFQKLVGDEAFIPESSLMILKRIGAGSFATVEVAEYTPHGSPAGTLPTRVAVKRLRRGSALDAVDLAHEARVLRGLSHKYITKYIGVGASQSTRGGPLVDEHCYIVQAFVGGGTLKRIVAAQTEAKRASLTSAPPPQQQQQHPSTSSPSSSSAPSPSKQHSPVGSIQCHYTHEDAARWGSQIAEGLAYLHGANPVILHRDLKLENVLLTEAPRAKERKIYPPARAAAEAAATGSNKAEAAAVSPKEEGEKGKEATTPRPEAKLADFGLAVSFVSPDIATRRSALPRYVSSLASVLAGKEKEASATTATAAAAAQALQQQDKLGDRRVSAVQAQMLRADAGQRMNDPRVARAASELETALSKWTGAGAAERTASSSEAKPTSSSSTPLAAAAATASEKPAPLANRRISVSNLLRATNRRVYALTGKTGSYLYMAPEVTLSLPYNEQADVFSLGTVIWELLSRKTIGAAVLSGATGDLSRVAELYAHRVARGFRPPLPLSWPEEVRTLVTECWDARPAVRPRAGEVGKRLQALLTKGTFAEFDAVREKEEDEAVWAAMAEAKSARERGVAAEIAGCLGCCSVM